MVSYAASPAAGASARCADNLKAAYVVISEVAKTEEGRKILTNAMNLCTPLDTTPQANVATLLAYLQTPLFDLAEGSYPFATDYITFALTGLDAPLPPWAMQASCSSNLIQCCPPAEMLFKHFSPVPLAPDLIAFRLYYAMYYMSAQVMCEPLGKDYGVSITGQPSEVIFSVLGEKSLPSTVEITVDWDTTASARQYSQTELEASGVLDVASAVAQAIQVWYNVTGLEPSCINWEGGAAPNMATGSTERATQRRNKHQHTVQTAESATATALQAQKEQRKETVLTEDLSQPRTQAHDHDHVCVFPSPSTLDVGTAWNSLVCNEGINLVNWWAQGTGKDMYWPPNRERNATLENQVSEFLSDSMCRVYVCDIVWLQLAINI